MMNPKSFGVQGRSVVVIGCGTHYFSKYHSVLEQDGHRLILAVDLETERSAVINNFTKHKLQPEHLIFLPEQLRDVRSEANLGEFLDEIMTYISAEIALICTEPKSHRACAAWAMERGLDVFMDKPISAVALPAKPGILLEDYNYLVQKSVYLGRSLCISCERRVHPGYALIKEEITYAIEQHNIPVTSIHVIFGGGNWLYPDEYMSLENHPFRYGYGVLFHSGYHYIDVIASIAEMNTPLVELALADPEIQIMATRPCDIIRLANIPTRQNSVLNTTCRINNPTQWINARRYGEVDLGFIGRYHSSHGHGLLFSGQLLETTVSARIIDKDKAGNGRVRSEQLLINLGHFCSISLRASSYRKLANPLEPEDFELVIGKHPSYRGGGVQRFSRKDLSIIQPNLPLGAASNGWARTHLLRSFLAKENTYSSILSHQTSMQLLSRLADKLTEDIEKRTRFVSENQE